MSCKGASTLIRFLLKNVDGDSIFVDACRSKRPHVRLVVGLYQSETFVKSYDAGFKPGIHLRQRQTEERRDILGLPRLVLKNVYQFLL